MWSHFQNNLIQFMNQLYILKRYMNEKKLETNPIKKYMFQVLSISGLPPKNEG